MKKIKKRALAITLLATILISNIVAYTASSSNSGWTGNYQWSTSLNGTSSSCSASTSFQNSSGTVTVTVYGTYISPDFTGYQTKSGGNGGTSYASGSISVLSTDRFVSAYSQHNIYSSSTSVSDTRSVSIS